MSDTARRSDDPDWGRHDEVALAVDELLDAAGRAFAELGVGKATMADVCRAAGCARSTLYRYFPTRGALHLAYVNRAALRIAARMPAAAAIAGPSATVLTERILFGIRSVREDPLLATWFSPENISVPIALSRDSEVLDALTAGFTDGLDLPERSAALARRQGQWLLRSIVSLLAMPADDPEEERATIERFIVPALLTAHRAWSS